MGIQDWAERRWADRTRTPSRPEAIEIGGEVLVFTEVVENLDRRREVLRRLLELGRVPDAEAALLEFEAAAAMLGVFMGRTSDLD